MTVTRLTIEAHRKHVAILRHAVCAIVGFVVLWMSMTYVDGDEIVGQASPSKIEESPITESDREHWAFRPIASPSIPVIKNPEWITNGIDAFVVNELQSRQLRPAAIASSIVLLRRLKFDLLGLPLTIEETSDAQEGLSFEEYGHYVERFLASPRYGEHHAQAWLDLARFAETDGFEHDRTRKDAWRYRDWVIDSLNQDHGYDQFIRDQLYGELDDDPSNDVATMFALAGADMPDLNDQQLRRHDRLNELTSTIGSVLLGLQFHCAQCHDHKYDALSQADFYRLRAVFEPTVPDLQRDKPFHFFEKGSAKPSTKAYFYVRGEVNQPSDEMLPAAPRIASRPNRGYFAATNRDPRIDFADWLFDRDNPLTARVAVNRLWQLRFGRGIFETPSDVGVMNADPSHPELLDWLATELRDNGWSLKHIDRLIVTSSTYRQASFSSKSDDSHWKKRIATDPANRYLSRFPRRRLSAEALRDAMLFVSGELHFSMHGPGDFPPLPEELTATLLKGQWTTSPDRSDHSRRSIYVFARRNLRYPLFDAFDRPDAGASCARRDQSTTAIQSLEMWNSEFSAATAKNLFRRILAQTVSSLKISSQTQLPDTIETGNPRSIDFTADAEHQQQLNQRFIDLLFAITLNRPPTPAESTSAIGFIDKYSSEPERGFITLCLAALNTNEFLTID